MAEINSHPLLFTFRDVITGDGFLAGVTLSGRALVVQEGTEWWMYGVRPGAIAETAATAQELLLRFPNRYREIVFDIASECRTFDLFKEEVERFFYEPDPEEERRWEDAVAHIRSSNLAPPPPFSNLPREAPETRPSQIAIERLDGVSKRFMPTDNVSATYLVPMAA